MERGAMEEIGSLLAGGLTYKEAMKFFGSEDALNQTAAKMSGTNSVTNNTSVQAPITVNATINSEMDIDVVAHRLGEKLSSTVAASIPRV
jgi:osmotically-inducible protein OsmY